MNFAKIIIFKITLILFGIGIIMGERSSISPELTNMLPLEITGWKAITPDETYNADTLYKYIDGSAEVYRSFNVQNVLARRYAKENAFEIIVDIFDMGSSKDAFGVYHHYTREFPSANIGQDSEYTGTSLSFWKNNFFVSIVAYDETEDVKKTVLELGKFIATKIHQEGQKPNLINLLPTSDLHTTTPFKRGKLKELHYFHNHYCLNKYYFLADENVLNLDKHTEGILARFGESTDSSFVIVIIRYTSTVGSQKALRKFLSVYLPNADSEGMAQTENSKWAFARVIDNLIIAVLDSQSKEEIKNLLKDIEKLYVQNFNPSKGEK